MSKVSKIRIKMYSVQNTLRLSSLEKEEAAMKYKTGQLWGIFICASVHVCMCLCDIYTELCLWQSQGKSTMLPKSNNRYIY